MTTSSKVPNVDAKVKEILEKHNRKVDLTNEIQTEIDPNVYFNRNSVNLLRRLFHPKLLPLFVIALLLTLLQLNR